MILFKRLGCPRRIAAQRFLKTRVRAVREIAIAPPFLSSLPSSSQSSRKDFRTRRGESDLQSSSKNSGEATRRPSRSARFRPRNCTGACRASRVLENAEDVSRDEAEREQTVYLIHRP